MGVAEWHPGAKTNHFWHTTHPPEGWPRRLSWQESPLRLWVAIATIFIWLSIKCV